VLVERAATIFFGLKSLVSAVRLANDFHEMNQPWGSERSNHTNRHDTAGAERLARPKTWSLTLFVPMAIASALAMNSCSKAPPDPVAAPAETPATNVVAAAKAAVTNTASENLLSGHWVRPDGGYVIEVRGAQPDGKLEAYYFNPNPINVSRAEWRREHDGLHVFIELRDQNYPGATYKLHYLPDKDQLAGEYFQPVYQQTYEVQFIRQSR